MILIFLPIDIPLEKPIFNRNRLRLYYIYLHKSEIINRLMTGMTIQPLLGDNVTFG